MSKATHFAFCAGSSAQHLPTGYDFQNIVAPIAGMSSEERSEKSKDYRDGGSVSVRYFLFVAGTIGAYRVDKDTHERFLNRVL